MFDSTNGCSPRRLPIETGRFSAVPRPFLKWAGSKQALIHQILPILPPAFGRYYEPFLGSGALFFSLKPKKATLSDISADLINVWTEIRENSNKIIEYLSPLKPDRELYYKIRESRSADPTEHAAEFIYLNRSCWNGLYRVNSQGKFNVPYGAPKSDFIFDRGNLVSCAKLLSRSGVTIRKQDFELATCRARPGDLVFFDPPYVTKHNNNGFRDWNETLFSWSDQVRLANHARTLANRGVFVVVANAAHDDIANLYIDFKKMDLHRSSTLAANSRRRGPTVEALFYNRQP